MKGIVLISHGDMAKGMAQSATLFLGDSIPQLTYCCLQQEDAPEAFAERLESAVRQVDSGEGVVLLADLFGGTPCNQAIVRLKENTELIAGMNFPMLLELLTGRMGGETDIDALVESGRNAIMNGKAALAAGMGDEEDD